MLTQRQPSLLGLVDDTKSLTEHLATSSSVFVKHMPRNRSTEGELDSRVRSAFTITISIEGLQFLVIETINIFRTNLPAL